MKNFLLSIVTINYNDAEGLNKTIASVVGQKSKYFEYIVIDGASNDNSLEIIKNYVNNLDYYVSEKDEGIYNAMNKGIKRAKGKYLLFLNSGDVLVNQNVLKNCKNEFLEDIDIISGNLEYYSGSNLIIRQHPKQLTFSYLVNKTISHPSTFIKKKLFNEYGLYNENLKIVSDWEFFFKVLALNGATYKSINVNISHFDMTGISSNQNNLVKEEKKKVFEKYLPYIFNNEEDTFIFGNYIEKNKRILFLLKEIEKNSLIRKIVSLQLLIMSKLTIFFK